MNVIETLAVAIEALNQTGPVMSQVGNDLAALEQRAGAPLTLTATDGASSTLAGIGASVRETLAQVGAGVDAMLVKVGAGLQGAGEKMQQWGGKLTMFGTLPIAALGAASVSMASDLEESTNKTTVVFGEQADAILAFADTSAEALGQSKQQALEATGTFGNLFTAMGIGDDAASDMSVGMVTLASDLASFNNIDPTLALEKLRAGLVGETEPLRTLGVNLSAATVEAKALQMGLVESTVDMEKVNAATMALSLAQTKYTEVMAGSTATDAQKRAALEGLSDAQDRQENATRDVAAAQSRLATVQADTEASADAVLRAQNALTDAQVRLADTTDDVANARLRVDETNRTTLPTMAQQEAAALAVSKAEQTLQEAMAGQTNELTAAQKAQAAYALIMEQTTTAQGDFERTSEGLANQQRILRARLADSGAELGTQLLPIALQMVEGLGWLLDKFEALGPSGQRWVLVLGGVVAAAGPVLSVVGMVASGLGGLIGLIGGAGGVTALLGGLGAALTVLTGPVGLVLAAVAGLAVAWSRDWFGIRTKTGEAIEGIKATVGPWIDDFGGQWDSFTSGLRENLATAGDNMESWWRGHVETVKGVASSGWAWLQGAYARGTSALQGGWQTYWQTVEVVASSGWAWLQGAYERGTSALQGVSVAGGEVLQAGWQTYWQAVEGAAGLGWELLTGAFGRGLASVQGVAQAGEQALTGDWRGAMTTLVSTASDNLTWLRETFSQRFTAIRDFLRGLGWVEMGRNVVQGLVDGIRSKLMDAVAAIRDVGNGILDWLQDAFDFGSPSRVTGQFGRWIGEGLGGGIGRSSGGVVGMADALVGEVLRTFDAGAGKVQEMEWTVGGGKRAGNSGQWAVGSGQGSQAGQVGKSISNYFTINFTGSGSASQDLLNTVQLLEAMYV